MSGVPARVPRGMAARKPPHGAACNNCGLCCMVSLCDLGQHAFGREALPGPCPALRLDADARSYCALTRLPDRGASAAAALLIFAGVGCDARINGEPESAEQKARERAWDAEHAEELAAARTTWGMPEP